MYCQWMIYRGCKNACPYCEVPSTTADLNDDHLSAVLKTFELLEGKVKRLEFIGGEMLDYPFINEIVYNGNKSSIERIVLITTGINKSKFAEVMKLANPSKWGFCFTLDMLTLKARECLEDKNLGGSARKSKAGWEAFYQYENFWRRGHVTVGRHNLKDLPKIAKLRREDWEMANKIMKELIILKKNYGSLFLPSDEDLDLITRCCKESYEMYPCGCGDTMPYLRIGDRICPDGTFGLMVCSDFYLPNFSVKNWVEKKEEVENAWAGNVVRRFCANHEGCAWSVSLTLSFSQK